VVDWLSSHKCKALSSIPSTTEKKKKKRKRSLLCNAESLIKESLQSVLQEGRIIDQVLYRKHRCQNRTTTLRKLHFKE
jgi:hypothetical protein